MNKLLLILTFLGGLTCKATIKVAVIDTGFDFKSTWSIQPKLCPTGHKDFTGYGLNDLHGHGTHIAGLIALNAKDSDYCLLIIKFYHTEYTSFEGTKLSTKAIKYAIDQKVDVINYSGGGVDPWAPEKQVVLKALNAGIKVIVSAGNNNSNLLVKTYYPALYDARIEVIGSKEPNGERSPFSNYGKAVTHYELGNKVLSILPNGKYGTMNGTSQATAIFTGKYVYKLNKVKKLCSKYIDK